MREEILRARQKLLTGQDSARVDSVIRLLEQTYQRLESEAAAALVSAKSASAAENAATATAVPTVPKLTLKRKAPVTEPGLGNSLSADTEVRKVLSTYATTQGNTNATNPMAGSGALSPAAKRRRSGRTSGSVTTVSLSDPL